MRIDVWSDVVCPWCYLGRRRLEVALEGLTFRDGIEVRWRAFQLDPGAGDEPKDLTVAIERKYGPGAFDGMIRRMVPLGREVDIDYRFDLAQRVSSLPALRLLAWAEDTAGSAVADALHERLFRAYFTDGANIARPAALADWAAEVGIDRDAAKAAVESQAGSERVAADLAEARERGLTGVPAFLLDGKLVIPGAQDIDTMRRLITRMYERSRAASA